VEFVQEDLVIKKVATKYTVRNYECPCCNKGFSPEFEPGFIGPTAKSLSVLLHYYSGVTFNKIKEIYGWFGLDVSEGSLALWGRKFCKKFESSCNSLKDLVRQSGYVNVDETGWPIDGANHWLWMFRNEDAVVYRIDESRGSGVVKDVPGEDYQGVLESVFYSAYNPVECRKQKCLVHLLRAVRDWNDSGNFEKRSFHYSLNRVIDDAKKLAQHRDSLTCDIYDEKIAGFLRDYEQFLETNFSVSDYTKLMKRLRKHGNDLWTFLKEPIPWHNNSAELAIRRVVVNRKVSNGNRSSPGARVQEVILSIIQTAKQQGKNLIETLLNEQKLVLDFS
jgi:transposase